MVGSQFLGGLDFFFLFFFSAWECADGSLLHGDISSKTSCLHNKSCCFFLFFFLQACQLGIELAHLLRCNPSEILGTLFLGGGFSPQPLIETTLSLFNFKMYQYHYQGSFWIWETLLLSPHPSLLWMWNNANSESSKRLALSRSAGMLSTNRPHIHSAACWFTLRNQTEEGKGGR